MKNIKPCESELRKALKTLISWCFTTRCDCCILNTNKNSCIANTPSCWNDEIEEGNWKGLEKNTKRQLNTKEVKCPHCKNIIKDFYYNENNIAYGTCKKCGEDFEINL